MDYETRNEWEHYCALVEIEEDVERFLEISSNIVRPLAEQEARLKQQQKLGSRLRYPEPSNVT